MQWTLIISLFFASWTLKAQDVKLINKLTNSYVTVYKDSKKSSVHLVSKNPFCLDKWIKIPTESLGRYIDSLRKSGWTKWLGSKIVTNKFKCVLLLDSIVKIPKLSDSTFKFYYHFDAIDLKGNKYFPKDYTWTTNIENVKKAIKNQEFGYDVYMIKGTSLYEINFSSFTIFNSDKTPGSYQSGNLFSLYF